MNSNDDAVYTHGYKVSSFAGIDSRTAQSHAFWLLPHLEPGMRALDVGPGPGTITVGIAEAVSPGAVTGVELGASYVELANKNAREAGIQNLEVIQGDANDLQFDNDSMDVIFSFAVLEHIPDPSQALAEFYRVLKPGGLVAVASGAVSLHAHPANSPFSGDKLDFFLKVWESNGGHPDLGREQPQLVDNAGFVDVSIGGFYESDDARGLANSFPELLQDPELIKKAGELGVASESEISQAVEDMRDVSDRPVDWHMKAWFWALGRKPS